MSKTKGLLDQVQIASPCNASWSRMAGDDRVRFCAQCKLNVYNIAAMHRTEAEKLIRETEGRLCARIYRRHDGTIITDNCPVGLRAMRRRLRWTVGVIAAGFALLVGCLTLLGGAHRRTWFTRLRDREPFVRVADWLSPNEFVPPLAGVMLIPNQPLALPVIDAETDTQASNVASLTE